MTNPPIDPFREAFVTSMRCMIGPERDITTQPYHAHAHRLELEHPILTTTQLEAFRRMKYEDWKSKVSAHRPFLTAMFRQSKAITKIPGLHLHCRGSCARPSRMQWHLIKSGARMGALRDGSWCIMQVVDTTWPVEEGAAGMKAALDRVAAEAMAAIDSGFNFVILSDRAAGVALGPLFLCTPSSSNVAVLACLLACMWLLLISRSSSGFAQYLGDTFPAANNAFLMHKQARTGWPSPRC